MKKSITFLQICTICINQSTCFYWDVFHAALFSKLQLFCKDNIFPDLSNHESQQPRDKIVPGEAIKQLDLAVQKTFSRNCKWQALGCLFVCFNWQHCNRYLLQVWNWSWLVDCIHTRQHFKPELHCYFQGEL